MTVNNPKKRRLGRGLEALLGPNPHVERPADDGDVEPRILPLSSARNDANSLARSYEPSDLDDEASHDAESYSAPSFRSSNVSPPLAPHTAVPSPTASSSASLPRPVVTAPSARVTMETLAGNRSGADRWSASMSDDYDTASSRQKVSEPEEGGMVYLSVDRIVENPFQPRREFSESELASLAESLKEHDMLQPILVRRIGDGYQIISGERRWRAAQLAGWTKIPARLRQADDRLVAELAIVENLQRKDLNALEKALSFKRYLQEHDSTQEELASRLKIDRSTIANLIRLLELPDLVQDAIRSGGISAGHARALLPLGNAAKQIEYCNKVQRETWSVRETERRVMDSIEIEERSEDSGAEAAAPKRKPISPQIQALEQQLRRALGTSVEIRSTAKGKGKIVIHFGSNDEFIRIRERLTDDGSPDDLRRVG